MMSASAARVLVPLQIRGTPPPWDQAVHALQGNTMGTTWSVRFAAPAGLRLGPIEAAITRVLDAVIDEMSHWEPGSRLSIFNRAAASTRHALPAGFATVMQAALRIAEASGGAFDPGMGDAVRRWGFGPPGAIDETSSTRCDWRALVLDGQDLLQPGGVCLDLSAIAKGHAVDRVAQILEDLGIADHLAEVGGELRGAGLKPDGQPWWVDIEAPAADAGLPPLRIALHGLAIATSGDYRRYRIDEVGRRLSHSIDPRSGEPIAHGLASVSVVHESAMWADGWSTALMVLGLDDGLALARAQGLAAHFVQRTDGGGFAERFSPAMEALLS